jgi:hypothetical protein
MCHADLLPSIFAGLNISTYKLRRVACQTQFHIRRPNVKKAPQHARYKRAEREDKWNCSYWFVTYQKTNMKRYVWLEVLTTTTTSMKMAVFRVLRPCSLVPVYSTVHRQCGPLKRWQTSTRLHGATTQKAAIFIKTDPIRLNQIRLFLNSNYWLK